MTFVFLEHRAFDAGSLPSRLSSRRCLVLTRADRCGHVMEQCRALVAVRPLEFVRNHYSGLLKCMLGRVLRRICLAQGINCSLRWIARSDFPSTSFGLVLLSTPTCGVVSGILVATGVRACQAAMGRVPRLDYDLQGRLLRSWGAIGCHAESCFHIYAC